MTELFLVRHGETDWNRARRIQGLTDIPLNDTGREQARETGRLLARRRWDGVYASPLSRAMETATLIASELGADSPTPLPEVVERNYGQAEGLDFAELDRLFPEGSRVPGRESREAVARRVVAALTELAARRPGERLVIVSHGGAIRSALTSVQPDVRHGTIANGSVHSFRVLDGTLELIAFDDPIEDEAAADGRDDLDEQNALESRDAELPAH